MSCNADIETEVKYNVLSIPLQAVTVRDTKGIDKTPDVDEDAEGFGAGKVEKEKDNEKIKPKTVVFVYEDGKAKKTSIETGISDKGSIEVINGLKEGAMLISCPFSAVNKELQGGEAVEVDTNFYKFKNK
jgi:HlyD family secretion protein